MSIGVEGIGVEGIGVEGIGVEGIGQLGSAADPYPAGRIANYPFTADASNTLGADATNNGGTFVSDGTRGTVWQGDGVNDYLSGILHNSAGNYYSFTCWFNSDDISVIKVILGATTGSFDLFPVTSTSFRYGGGAANDFVTVEMSDTTWYQVGMSIDDSSGTANTRVYLNGVESSTGVKTKTDAIPVLDRLGFGAGGFEWAGKFSICNVADTLWTAADFLDVYNLEVLP